MRQAKGAGNALWEFSLKVYQEPEVENACLLMQDKLDIDINMLLTCLWLGVSGRGRLNEAELNDLTQQVAFWQEEIIQPMRQVRRRLKDLSKVGGEEFTQLRKSVSASELDAEQMEQQMLYQALQHRLANEELSQVQRLSDTIHNLFLLLARDGSMEYGWNRSVAILLDACFPTATRGQILDVLGAVTSADVEVTG
ncbi:MAG: TIGR02444 family protein [Gammaproteobacteria bacterium]|nr:TIGR02444 family protein [Gammaproteobacteria bacterium]